MSVASEKHPIEAGLLVLLRPILQSSRLCSLCLRGNKYSLGTESFGGETKAVSEQNPQKRLHSHHKRKRFGGGQL